MTSSKKKVKLKNKLPKTLLLKLLLGLMGVGIYTTKALAFYKNTVLALVKLILSLVLQIRYQLAALVQLIKSILVAFIRLVRVIFLKIVALLLLLVSKLKELVVAVGKLLKAPLLVLVNFSKLLKAPLFAIIASPKHLKAPLLAIVYLPTHLKKPLLTVLALPGQLYSRVTNKLAVVFTKVKTTLFTKKVVQKTPKAALKKTKPKVAKKQIKHNRLSAFFIRFRFFMFGTAFALITVLVPLELSRLYKQLPKPELLLQPSRSTTRIFDRKGRLLYEIYSDKQFEYVTLNKVPTNLINATIAVEDDEFYTHSGIRPLSIIRAAKATFLESEIQGASTITQQLIKNVLLSTEQTFERKAKEAVLAIMVERKFTKNQILELYLNNTPYGGTSWGVQSASKKIFGKNVWDLSLAESSMLAGLPLSPTAYSPYSSLEKAKSRQEFVLKRMTLLGYITEEEAKNALAEKLEFASQKEYIRAPHFVNFVRDELNAMYGPRLVELGGLAVTTSLDLDLQDKVQKIVTEEVDKSGFLNISNGASLVVDVKKGEILAYVGSKKYFADDYDGAYDVVRAPRQPGSSIKILPYAMALESGMTPASTLSDSPISINTGTEVYTPVNYDGAFHGSVSLRGALANSYNIPAVRLSVKLGPDAIIQKGKEAGLTGWETDGNYGYSVVLGGREARLLDMTNLYTTFARGGKYVPLTGITSVKDANGFEIYQDERTPKQVFSEGVSYLISKILSDNSARTPAFGPNSQLVVDNRKNIAVKTGTTDLKKDNWTLGYTPDVAVGVWVGNNNGDPMSPYLASGLSGAAPIWNQVMHEVLLEKEDTPFDQPESVVAKTYKECNLSEYFISGTESDSVCKKLKKEREVKNERR